MADVSIRDAPDGGVRAIDADAKRQGLSRSECLRRSLERPARTVRTTEASVTVADLEAFSEAFADLEDPDVMKRVWEDLIDRQVRVRASGFELIAEVTGQPWSASGPPEEAEHEKGPGCPFRGARGRRRAEVGGAEVLGCDGGRRPGEDL